MEFDPSGNLLGMTIRVSMTQMYSIRSVCVCVCACVCTYSVLYVCACVRLCVRMCVSVCVRMCVCLCMNLCVNILSVCTYVRMSMYSKCTFVCLCKSQSSTMMTCLDHLIHI